MGSILVLPERALTEGNLTREMLRLLTTLFNYDMISSSHELHWGYRGNVTPKQLPLHFYMELPGDRDSYIFPTRLRLSYQ